MNKERQAILSLIALGRITPAEAERLLAASNAGREEPWLIAAGTLYFAQFLPALGRMAHSLLPGLPALHHAAMAITYWIGGLS